MKRGKRAQKAREFTRRTEASYKDAGLKVYKRWLKPEHFEAMDKHKAKLEKAQ